MEYCKDCDYYIPKARYVYEMKDPKMRICKHRAICVRIIKLMKEEQKRMGLQTCLFDLKEVEP